ncbi:DUF362 domain-containing protein [Ruminiclostridium cellobioparum]|uniref:DUF362 domain-containing protein n=1 Tax=Ruminiclostridium cellobioparum subsp. termitidis CT1112 TaxID=1195236 RepID=S0FW40_RUMCE|nr:DUF362 domain-containing protein [Ruminiclostridium cellobioparum]EMS73374.1 hypothetical protein CTER_0547 [Ruminiclostridium cellobioparum subsp. termitidis CT1112]
MRQRKWNNSNVAITHNSDEAAAIKQAIELLKITESINSSDVVVITPNWVNKKQPDSATVVGPESLRQIIRMIKDRNPKRIVVATGTADGETKDVMDSVGFGKVISDEGVEFVDLNHGPFVRINLNHPIVTATNLNKLFEEVTVLISFTQLKQHEEATMSAAIKNIALGWPPADEHGQPKKNLGIHTELHGFISAMAQQVPIDLSIISASPAMIGTGPSKGIARHTGLVVAGCDPVAADTVGARLLGFKPQAVRYLFECSNKKIGESVVENINIAGIPLVEAENIFSQAAYGDGLAMDMK